MAFVVEDGTSKADANAYADLAFVAAYHLDRNHANWRGNDDAKRAAIVHASEYVDKRFGRRLRGQKSTSSQSMQFPRAAAQDDNGFTITGVPLPLKKAIAEYALRSLLLGELAPDPTRPVADQDNSQVNQTRVTTTPGVVKSTSTTVGPVSTSITYESITAFTGQSSRTASLSSVDEGWIPAYPAADMLLEELLVQPSMSGRIRRGS